MYDTVIVRYGEIFLKSDYVRKRFEDLLVRNMEAKMRKEKIEYRVYRKRHRIYVKTPGTDAVCAILEKTFGVVSVSPAREISSSKEDVLSACVELAVENIKPNETFAVRVQRAGSHEYKSKDLEAEAGSRILDLIPAKVDLEHPEKTIFAEIRDEVAYVYGRKIECLGGLPYGSQGTLISLLSTGIDSPVSSWMMMRRGCKMIFLHFGEPEDIKDIVAKLASYAGEELPVYCVPKDEVLEKISAHSGRYTCVVCKRFMHRLAEKLAEHENALGIVSGENMGQVASQTLANLKQINCLSMPVYRPLIALDKDDIIKVARKIGTFELAKGGRCPFVPDSPSTEAKDDAISAAEEGWGLGELLEDAKDRYILKQG
ncbi:MAG: tRNA uracil 4-sulfurtransferase ThiI [Candidatus Altiarchaeia archaeon]